MRTALHSPNPSGRLPFRSAGSFRLILTGTRSPGLIRGSRSGPNLRYGHVPILLTFAPVWSCSTMIPAGPPYSSAIQTNERKINFMRHRNIMVLVAAFLALAASRAEAIIINYFPVGISLGQSARLNLANIGETRGIIINYRFLDSDGVVMAQE